MEVVLGENYLGEICPGGVFLDRNFLGGSRHGWGWSGYSRVGVLGVEVI